MSIENETQAVLKTIDPLIQLWTFIGRGYVDCDSVDILHFELFESPTYEESCLVPSVEKAEGAVI